MLNLLGICRPLTFRTLTFSAAKQLEGVLGVFQKLANSPLNDHEGFYVAESVIEYVPLYVDFLFIYHAYHLLNAVTVKLCSPSFLVFSTFASSARRPPSL